MKEHTFPDGTKRKLQTNPVKAIRDHCKWVCCQVSTDNPGSTEAWKECNITTCTLHPFRNGTNPHRSRVLTDEDRRRLSELAKTNFNHRSNVVADK